MIHADAGADRLAIARIAVFGIWFVNLAITPVRNFALLPAELLDPPAMLRPFPVETWLASEPTVVALKLLGLALTAACILGVRPWRPIAATTVGVFLWHDAVMKSLQGYDNHAQAAVLFVAVVLAVAPAADALSAHPRRQEDREDRSRYAGPLLLATFIVGLTYTVIGLRRLTHGGVAVFTDGSLERWVTARSQQYAATDFEFGTTMLDLPGAGTVLALGMVLVTILEVLSLLVLRSPRLRAVWLAGLVPFHLSTLLLMNIFFWENLILLAVLFTGLPDRLLRRTVDGTNGRERPARTKPLEQYARYRRSRQPRPDSSGATRGSACTRSS
jgi:hypothetical protein